MAGWRIGFCAGNPEMVRALGTIKAYYDYGMFQAIQVAAIVALRHTEAAVEAQAAIYQHRATCWSKACAASDGISRRRGLACSCGQKFPTSGAAMDTLSFAMKLLEEGDVAVSPGSGFGPAGEGYLRMAPWKMKAGCVRPCGKSAGAWGRKPVASRKRNASAAGVGVAVSVGAQADFSGLPIEPRLRPSHSRRDVHHRFADASHELRQPTDHRANQATPHPWGRSRRRTSLIARFRRSVAARAGSSSQ